MNYTKEDLKEVGAIASIISDHLADKIYGNKRSPGYIITAFIIADWAIEFYDKTKHVINWEKYYELNEFLFEEDMLLDGCCWDDYILSFADIKFNRWVDLH